MNSSDIKVSVVIPVYNAEKYIRECLESIISQSLQDLEIICVNDGSIDGSMDILKEFSEKYQKIKCLIKRIQEHLFQEIRDYVRQAENTFILWIAMICCFRVR